MNQCIQFRNVPLFELNKLNIASIADDISGITRLNLKNRLTPDPNRAMSIKILSISDQIDNWSILKIK